MFLSKTLYLLLSTGSTGKTGNCPNMTEKLLTGMSSINTNKQGTYMYGYIILFKLSFDLQGCMNKEIKKKYNVHIQYPISMGENSKNLNFRNSNF